MAGRPGGDVWNIVDSDKDSQWYRKNFKFDFPIFLVKRLRML